MMEDLYQKLRGPLIGYCQGMTHDWAEAEDIVQETYLRAMTHREVLRSMDKNQRRTWLYTTARNLFIDRTRRRVREQGEEGLEQISFESDFTQAAVVQLMGRLSDQDRAIFSMRHFAGYNASEIGEMLDMPASTVRARLATARRQLAKWCEKE